MLPQFKNLFNSDNNFLDLFLTADSVSLSCNLGSKNLKFKHYKNLQNI